MSHRAWSTAAERVEELEDDVRARDQLIDRLEEEVRRLDALLEQARRLACAQFELRPAAAPGSYPLCDWPIEGPHEEAHAT